MGATLQANKSKGATPEINITPLVDVVLVLLIIFMVVTPALNEGAQIELPKVLMPDAKQKDLHPIEVTIAPDGTTVVEKQNIDPKELKATLIRLHEKDAEPLADVEERRRHEVGQDAQRFRRPAEHRLQRRLAQSDREKDRQCRQ